MYSCSTCGATLFWQTKGEEFPEVCIGLLENAKDLVKFDHHCFIADTKDGGISDWVGKTKGDEIERLKQHRGQGTLPPYWKQDATGEQSTSSKALKAWCKCKGVQFQVTRPTEDTGKPPSPQGLSIF